MKMLQKMSFVLCAAALAQSAMAQTAPAPVDISVVGAITPASCTIAMNGGGVYDFGEIKAAALGTTLPAITKDVAINCTTDTLVSVSLTDNTTPTTDGGDGSKNYGLGHTASGAAIGSYQPWGVLGTMTLADGSTVTPIRWGAHKLDGENWQGYGNNWYLYQGYQYVQNKDMVGTSASPIATKAQTFGIKIVPTLNAASKFNAEDLANDIQLAGTASLNMRYL